MFTPETSPLLCLGCQNVIPPDPPDPNTGATKLRGICPICEGPLQLCGQGTPATVFPLPDGSYATQEDFAKFMADKGIQQHPDQQLLPTPNPTGLGDGPITSLPPSPPQSAPGEAGQIISSDTGGIDKDLVGGATVAGDPLGGE